MDTNRGIYDSAIKHRVYIEDEIEDTDNYLAWITNRYLEIEDLIEALQTERCEASLIFVSRVREHYEALDAIALLRMDLRDWEAAGMPTLTEIKNLPSFSKLSAFTHLFKNQALKSFLALSEDGDDDYMDVSRREHDDDHEDNDREALVVESFDSGSDITDLEATVVDKVLERLDVFEEHLANSLKDLQNNEIRAGRDMVKYIQQAEREVWTLQKEEEKRNIYRTKLDNDLVLAVAYEEKCKATWEASVKATDAMKAEFAQHKEWFMAEMERIRGDIEVVEEVIRIFLMELAGIDEIIRN